VTAWARVAQRPSAAGHPMEALKRRAAGNDRLPLGECVIRLAPAMMGLVPIPGFGCGAHTELFCAGLRLNHESWKREGGAQGGASRETVFEQALCAPRQALTGKGARL
jgi:hypothetical protein